MSNKLLLLLCACLGVSAQSVCNFYVDSVAGSDSNNGTSTGTPWATLAHATVASVSAGQTLCLKRNSVFREVFNPTQSGAVGNPVTWGAYGTGLTPVVAGSDLLSGWQTDQGGYTWSAVWNASTQLGTSSWSTGGTGSRNARQYIQGSVITSSAATIRVKWRNHVSNASTLGGVSICPKKASSDPYDCTTTPTQMLQQGSGTWTLGAGGSSYSDATSFALTQGTDYLFNVWQASGGTIWYSSLSATGTWQWFGSASVNSTLTADVSGYTVEPNVIYGLDEVDSGTPRSPIANVYQASLAYAPTGVFKNDIRLANEKLIITDLAHDGDWYYDGSAQLLYLYSSASPALAVFESVNPSRVGVSGILADITPSNLVIENIKIKQSADTNMLVDGATNVLITDVESTQSWNSLMGVTNGVTNVSFVRCLSHDGGYGAAGNDRNGFAIGDNGPSSTNVYIINSAVYNIGNHCIELASPGDVNHLFGVTITGTTIHDCMGQGIQVGGGQTGIVVTFNNIYNCQFEGFGINDGMTGQPVSVFYNNTLYNNGLSGTTNRTSNIRISGATITMKNNITSSAIGPEVNVYTGTTNTIVSDYNDFYHPSGGNFMVWQGTPETFAQWKVSSGGDSHSVTGNPLLTNPPLDVSLQGGSPAKSTGIFVSGVNGVNPPNMGLFQSPGGGFSMFGPQVSSAMVIQ